MLPDALLESRQVVWQGSLQLAFLPKSANPLLIISGVAWLLDGKWPAVATLVFRSYSIFHVKALLSLPVVSLQTMSGNLLLQRKLSSPLMFL